MALNRSDKSRILRRYFPGMTRNSEMSTEPSELLFAVDHVAYRDLGGKLMDDSTDEAVDEVES